MTDGYFRRFYYDAPGWQNGSEQFLALVGNNLSPDMEALELGPGPGGPTSEFLAANCYSLHGLDIDSEALTNKSLDRCFIYDGAGFPLQSNRYDAVVADYVLEHVELPSTVFSEVSRVLKPGGLFAFRTPNSWHYVSIIARLTSHSFHLRMANRARGKDTSSHEPYPTFFRANEYGRLKSLVDRAGLSIKHIQFVEKEPSYMRFSKSMFMLGLAYERTVNSSEVFRRFRANIFCIAIKE